MEVTSDVVSDPHSLKARINSQLQGYFPVAHTDYTSVAVLVFYWEEADHPGYKQEAELVSKFFRDDLRYHPVDVYPIPSERSHLKVEKAVTDFLLEHAKPSSLIIIFYGGHGDRNDGRDQQRRSIWAA